MVHMFRTEPLMTNLAWNDLDTLALALGPHFDGPCNLEPAMVALHAVARQRHNKQAARAVADFTDLTGNVRHMLSAQAVRDYPEILLQGLKDRLAKAPAIIEELQQVINESGLVHSSTRQDLSARVGDVKAKLKQIADFTDRRLLPHASIWARKIEAEERSGRAIK